MAKMNGLLEKILADNKLRVFHYSSYWGRWSRRLKNYDEGDVKGIVEVNLTPIPACYNSNWEKDVIPVVFRIHGTTNGSSDRNEWGNNERL